MIQLVPMLLLLAASAVTSACETAFFNLTAHQRHELQSSRQASGRLAADLLRRPDQLLSTLLLLILALNISYFAASSILLLDLSRNLPAWLAVPIGIVPVFLLIIFGEMMPKMFALTHPMRLVLGAAPAIWAIDRLLRPVGAVLNALFTRPALRLLSPTPASTAAKPVTHEELAAALEASGRQGLIDRQTSALLREVVALQAIKVREVMVPRVDLIAFDLAHPRSELVQLIRRSGLKRVPVFRRDLDHLVGVIDARAALLQPQRALDALVQSLVFVPDLITVEHLLAEFRRSGRQMAVVVDEYGGTAGMVTLEDVVEQIVGDIYDPADQPDNPLRILGPNEYLVSGDLSIREWAAIFGQEKLQHPVFTVAGLMSALLGRPPRVGDVVRVRNLTITADTIERRRVRWARITLDDGASIPASRLEPPAP